MKIGQTRRTAINSANPVHLPHTLDVGYHTGAGDVCILYINAYTM